MAQSTVDLVRSVISLIEDKKERTLLKKEIAKHDASKESAEAAVEELKLIQEDLNCMHDSIQTTEEAEKMYSDAVSAVRQTKEETQEMLLNARNAVKDMYAEHDVWYADVQAREIEAGNKEASLKQNRTSVETELHKKEVLITQREVGLSKREEVAAKLVDEYTEKLSVLKQNVSELNG